MTTQAEKFTEIADAIRDVTNRNSNFKIIANNFASEIYKLEPRIMPYVNSFENGYNGLKAVKCASSYLLARVLGTDKFAYRQTNILSPSLKVRDNGYARIDCSTFVSLCLRGIPYENSPYAKHKENNATWDASVELKNMYGTEGWEFIHLDKQDKYHRDGKSIMFTDIGIEGHSSIRTAAHLGEYFYKNGYVIYDRYRDGELYNLTDLETLKLQPGDLIFWANPKNDNQNVLKRFRSITHVAMVAENTNFYYHVTGSEDLVDQDVIWYQRFDEGILKGEEGDSTLDDDSHPIGQLLMICRPDYRPKMKVETPIGINLLGYPWTQSRKASFTVIGLTFDVIDEHTLKVSGTGTGSNFGLKGFNNSQDHITLSPGTYQLSGIGNNRTSTEFTLQLRDASGKDFDEEDTIVIDKTDKAIRFPTGNGLCYDTFTLTVETDVIIKLWCSEGVVLTNELITPTLIRIS